MKSIEEKQKYLRLGKKGEEVAQKYLHSVGYITIETNYRKKCGEIDIISHREGIITFFEVKTVSRKNIVEHCFGSYYRPEDNVHIQKQKRLRKTIQLYISEKGIMHTEWQFDLINVYYFSERRVFRVEHIRNIVL